MAECTRTILKALRATCKSLKDKYSDEYVDIDKFIEYHCEEPETMGMIRQQCIAWDAPDFWQAEPRVDLALVGLNNLIHAIETEGVRGTPMKLTRKKIERGMYKLVSDCPGEWRYGFAATNIESARFDSVVYRMWEAHIRDGHDDELIEDLGVFPRLKDAVWAIECALVHEKTPKDYEVLKRVAKSPLFT
ncbi:MAG: hypothetical protein OXI94_17050 [Gemmatimonadota bacterium]|nr:hypothetical protein [Gemmatimonadota bacterium]MDE2829694.1 hypothetical protein [Gemmatimonadota bacterium]